MDIWAPHRIHVAQGARWRPQRIHALHTQEPHYNPCHREQGTHCPQHSRMPVISQKGQTAITEGEQGDYQPLCHPVPSPIETSIHSTRHDFIKLGQCLNNIEQKCIIQRVVQNISQISTTRGSTCQDWKPGKLTIQYYNFHIWYLPESAKDMLMHHRP